MSVLKGKLGLFFYFELMPGRKTVNVQDSEVYQETELTKSEMSSLIVELTEIKDKMKD